MINLCICSAWVCTFMCTLYASMCVFSCPYLFRWSKRKRNVTRFGSGSDNSKFNMQLSLATLSDRAAQKEKKSSSCITATTARWEISLIDYLTNNKLGGNSPMTHWCRLQSWGRAHQWKEVLAALWSTASRYQRWHWRPSHSSSQTHLYYLQEKDENTHIWGCAMPKEDDKTGKHTGKNRQSPCLVNVSK